MLGSQERLTVFQADHRAGQAGSTRLQEIFGGSAGGGKGASRVAAAFRWSWRLRPSALSLVHPAEGVDELRRQIEVRRDEAIQR